jgi:hypothetical protein
MHPQPICAASICVANRISVIAGRSMSFFARLTMIQDHPSHIPIIQDHSSQTTIIQDHSSQIIVLLKVNNGIKDGVSHQ